MVIIAGTAAVMLFILFQHTFWGLEHERVGAHVSIETPIKLDVPVSEQNQSNANLISGFITSEVMKLFPDARLLSVSNVFRKENDNLYCDRIYFDYMATKSTYKETKHYQGRCVFFPGVVFDPRASSVVGYGCQLSGVKPVSMEGTLINFADWRIDSNTALNVAQSNYSGTFDRVGVSVDHTETLRQVWRVEFVRPDETTIYMIIDPQTGEILETTSP